LINRLFDRLGAINRSLATLKLVDTLVQLPPRMAEALVSWSPEQKVKVYRSYNRNWFVKLLILKKCAPDDAKNQRKKRSRVLLPIAKF